MEPAFYASPGPFTELSQPQVELVRAIGSEPEGLCRAAQAILIPPADAFGADLSPLRMAERNTRAARLLLDRALELDPSPLDEPRQPAQRVVGTCRHFAVMACAFLRAVGTPARARCGFATYFEASKAVDHWVVEYWWAGAGRWVRIDPEILGLEVISHPEDLTAGQFLTGGEAWTLCRAGERDPADFGVGGTENWGPGEIRANAIRDLASLNKIEMLPWDEWGPMAASYRGETDDAFDRLIDQLAQVCAGADLAAVQVTYQGLSVPEDLLS